VLFWGWIGVAGLAIAAGLRLTLLCSYTAASTQVGIFLPDMSNPVASRVLSITVVDFLCLYSIIIDALAQ
jgi:hypothetical protein